MADTRIIEPVVRICAVISRHQQAIDWAIQKLGDDWGAVAWTADPLPFEANGFYTESMGSDLKKVLVMLDGFIEPGGLSEWKHTTNAWEIEYAELYEHPESRPLNLDCGYVTQAKLVLATTKDRDHRIYLRDGMFAEVTLNYVAKKWVHHRWTYPSYRTPEVAKFAQACRDRLRAYLLTTDGFRVVKT